MKHDDMKTLLKALLDEADVRVAIDLGVLVSHLEWLLETNRSINLTAIKDPLEGIRLHVADSLLALPEVLDAPAGPLLDIGTGGGFPGLPLAVASNRHAVLLDSVAKKSRALQEFVEKSGVSAIVVAARAEDFARDNRECFSCVVARAVAELPALVELASPFLPLGGRLIALKGRPGEDEVSRGNLVAPQAGLSRRSIRTVPLPRGGEMRTIITYEKTTVTRIKLPRRVGLAQSKPLA